MQYSATYKYIDPDFDFDRIEEGSWTAEYADEEEFVLALNRMAIASSQHAVVDFPEVEVRASQAQAPHGHQPADQIFGAPPDVRDPRILRETGLARRHAPAALAHRARVHPQSGHGE